MNNILRYEYSKMLNTLSQYENINCIYNKINKY